MFFIENKSVDKLDYFDYKYFDRLSMTRTLQRSP